MTSQTHSWVGSAALYARVYIDVNTQGGGQWHHHCVVGRGRSAHCGAWGGGHQARCKAAARQGINLLQTGASGKEVKTVAATVLGPGAELDARVYIDVNTQGGEQWHHHCVVGCGRSAHCCAWGGGHQARCQAAAARQGMNLSRKGAGGKEVQTV